jgi:D-alanyl-D-alanine carboxypeptidase
MVGNTYRQRPLSSSSTLMTACWLTVGRLDRHGATHNSHTTVENQRREAAIPARVARGWAVAIAIRHAAVTDPPENMKGTCVHAFAAKIKPMITGMTSSPEQATRQVLDALIADGDTPGLQYVFASADEALLAHHGGLANPGAHLPINDCTTFNAYSVTKTFTAAAVLQLVEQGRIELDRPIAQYCDRWPQSGAATVRQTLLHTAGFANPNPLPWVHLIDERAAFDRVRFVEDLMRTEGRPISKPGERYAYSNIGYLLLGELIERASGQPFVQYVLQHLIAPLHLCDGETLAFDIPRPQAHARGALKRFGWLNLVLGFVVDRDRLVDDKAGRWVQFRNHHVNGDAYGGLIANAHGLARYLQALLAHDDFLSPVSRALLFTTEPGPGPARSLGWFMGRLDDEPWYAHAGGGAGYYSEVRVYPRLGRASVVMFNRAGIRDEHILDRLDRFLIAGKR